MTEIKSVFGKSLSEVASHCNFPNVLEVVHLSLGLRICLFPFLLLLEFNKVLIPYQSLIFL